MKRAALAMLLAALLAACACTPPLPGDPIETNPARWVSVPAMPDLERDELIADACATRALLHALGSRFTPRGEQRYREICGD